MFKFEVRDAIGRFSFLDLYVISLAPLQHSVWFKPTNTGAYIPWCSDQPRQTKKGWIMGEGVPYLRLCSCEGFFNICVKRLTLCLMRLGYPRKTYSLFPITWSQHSKYQKRQGKIGGTIHIFKQTFHSSVPVTWRKLVKRLESSMIPFVPDLHIFLCFSTPPPLGCVWNTLRQKTLADLASKVDDDAIANLLFLQNLPYPHLAVDPA